MSAQGEITPYALDLPRRLRFGRGAAREAVGEIAALGRRIMLVHGSDAARAEWLLEALRANGADVTAIGCPGEPDLPGLEAAVATARETGAQALVGIGGGSVIDMAKAVAALAPGEAAPLHHLEVVGDGAPLAAAPLPFAALPSTAGTGAEVTKNAVIGVPEAGRKVSLRDARMVAALAVVDASLSDEAPGSVTLASGLDALVQVIEPYLCRRANPTTDALCRAAIPLGLAALPRLMEAETARDRDAMAQVSLWGGLALNNAGLGAVHGFAGPIGGLTGAPHGAICGALLPHVLRALGPRLSGPAGARLQEVEMLMAASLPGEGAPLDRLEAWMHASGLPRLAAMGLSAKDHAPIAAAALDSSSMRASPVVLDEAELQAILHAAA